MNITLPLPLNTSDQYWIILNMWVNAHEQRASDYKKAVGKSLRKGFWAEIFHRGKTDEELFDKEASMEDRLFMKQKIYREPITELTELLSAHTLAKIMETPASYTIPPVLVNALNKELQ